MPLECQASLLTEDQALNHIARTKTPTSGQGSEAQHEPDKKISESSNHHRRGSLLPKRSTSSTQIDLPIVQPEALARPPARIPSPSKLPQGPLQRSQSVKLFSSAEDHPIRRSITHQRAPSKTSQVKKVVHPSLGEPSTSNYGSRPRDITPMTDRADRLLEPRTQAAQVLQNVPPSKTHQEKPSTKPIYTQLPGRVARTPANAAAKLQRPTFSALQQSYSPKKTDRVVSNHAAQEPTVPRLQSPQYGREVFESRLELLHRHMMHRDAAMVQKEWQDSAEQSYERQFKDLVAIDSSLDSRETEHLEQLNVNAIMAWCSGSEEATLERKIQTLSTIVEEAWNASRPSGKYTLTIQAFEHWYARASEVQLQRLSNQSVANDHIHVLEGLGDGWKAEVMSLHGRMLQAADSLLRLGEVQRQSDLARCVTVLSEMLKNMLEELEIVQLIESQMVQQERLWVESSVNRIASGLRDGLPTAAKLTHRRR